MENSGETLAPGRPRHTNLELPAENWERHKRLRRIRVAMISAPALGLLMVIKAFVDDGPAASFDALVSVAGPLFGLSLAMLLLYRISNRRHISELEDIARAAGLPCGAVVKWLPPRRAGQRKLWNRLIPGK